MMARDFNAELRRDEALRQAEGISPAVRRSIEARLSRTLAGHGDTRENLRTPHWTWARAAVFASLALIVAVSIGIGIRQAPRRLGEFEISRESADLAARVEAGLVRIEKGAATLLDRPSGATLETLGPVVLRRDAAGVRVVRGRLKVSVAQRARGAAPATIFVSHGTIEVMGTSFTITQGANAGSVRLHEGSVRFRSGGDGLVTLRPGEELSWPLSAPAYPVAPPVSSAPAEVPSPLSAPSTAPMPKPIASVRSTEELLNYVEELRSRRQFEAAARELSRGLGSQPASARERLSFELGSLLTHQIRDARRACTHWTRHERQFRGGVYRDEVANQRRVLRCSAVGPTP